MQPSAGSILARQKYLDPLQQILTVLTEFYRPADPARAQCNEMWVVVRRPLEFVSLIHSPLGVCSCWLEAHVVM